MSPNVFVLVAFIFALVELSRSRAQSLLAWAVLCLALAHLWPLAFLR